LHVDGELDGEVVSTNVVEISRSGVVKSELKADKLIVAGKFFGNADCELVELTASGEIQGNLTSAGLVIENGGVFEGKSLRKPPGESNTVLRFHTDDAEGEHRNDSKPKAKEEKEAQSA
jgi:cytoskeletal protein CcmA (bactofilin family)